VDDSITGNLRATERAQINAPPEANTEYSRGSGPSRRPNPGLHPTSEGASESVAGTPGALGSGAADVLVEAADVVVEAPGAGRAAVALGALLGAVLILVSQFTALYQVHSATSALAIKTVGTGANHAWAGIPLALAAGLLACAVYRSGSRIALIGIAGLGIAMLLIGLLSDLPPTHATGLVRSSATGLVGSSATGFVRAFATRGAGLYMETLGAVVLLASGGLGLLMLARPAPDVRGVSAAGA